MVKRKTDNTMVKRKTDNTMVKRKTDNTMVKRKRTKGLQNIHIKQKIELHEPTKNVCEKGNPGQS
jgi:hypothetical protein